MFSVVGVVFYLLRHEMKYIAYKIVIFCLVSKKVNFPEIPEKIKIKLLSNIFHLEVTDSLSVHFAMTYVLLTSIVINTLSM